jgi:SanA protein
MSRKTIPFLLRGLIFAALVGLLAFAVPRLFVESYAKSKLYTVDSTPKTRVVIVFGAGLQRDRTPSAILRDRIETAVQLYTAGKVEKLLMSGDNRFLDYNEPESMRAYAIKLGVPEKDIVLDYAGRRTYDTCYRARHIFNVNAAILVTQNFHLPRALVTCNSLGIQATGVPAEIRRYRRSSYAYWYLREVPATTVALWEVWVSRPLPVLGKPETIFSQSTVFPTFGQEDL